MTGTAPYPLDARELGKIVGMFGPAGRVVDGPDGAGRCRVWFGERSAARAFAGVAVAGAHGARPFAESVRPVEGRGPGPVTVAVVLSAGWRPAVIACPFCGRGSGHESWCRLAVAS